MELGQKLKKIAHNYRVQITQTFKFTYEAFLPLKKDFEKFKDLLKEKEYQKAFEALSLKIKKTRENIKKSVLITTNEDLKSMEDKIKNKYKNYKIVLLTKEESDINTAFLLKDIAKHRSKSLLNMSFIYLMTLYEAFNKDFFFELFLNMPETLKSKEKQIDYETALSCKKIEELHENIVNKEIDQMGYINLIEFANYINIKFKIDLSKEFNKFEALKENYFRRNIIVHNSGRISEVYINKMNLNPDDLGKELNIDINYLERCFNNIHKYISFIKQKFLKKFNLSI